MADEKKADEKKDESTAEPEWLKRWEKDGRLEQVLRLEVLTLQREKLTGELEYDLAYFADWKAQNSPGARREWQRHQTAVGILNGLLAGAGGTIDERLKLVDKADWQLLTAISYKLAEQMMQRREQLKVDDEAKGKADAPASKL